MTNETPQPPAPTSAFEEFKEGTLRLLRSRKFWVLIAALATVTGALMSGQITTWEAVQAYIAALAVYSTGIAIVDAGAGVDKSRSS